MADVAVENKETTVVEKVVAEEVDTAKEATTAAEKAPVTANGAADSATDDTDAATDAATKENGTDDDAAHAPEEATAEEEIPAKDAADKSEAAVEESGEKQEATADETNGDSTDSTPAEAVKRKIAVEGAGGKTDAVTATPEKKAKLDETTKEDVQNGTEASEVAA